MAGADRLAPQGLAGPTLVGLYHRLIMIQVLRSFTLPPTDWRVLLAHLARAAEVAVAVEDRRILRSPAPAAAVVVAEGVEPLERPARVGAEAGARSESSSPISTRLTWWSLTTLLRQVMVARVGQAEPAVCRARVAPVGPALRERRLLAMAQWAGAGEAEEPAVTEAEVAAVRR
jgi:hypothetical protein